MKFLLGKSLFTPDSQEQSREAQTFLTAVHNSMLGMGLGFLLGPLDFLIPKSLKATAWRTAHDYIDICIETALHKKLQARGDEIHANRNESSHINRTLLEGLAQQTDNRLEIRSHILQGMMAAQDTTSILLSNTFFLLSRNPSVYERLRKEVLSLDLDSPTTFDKLRETKHLSNILNECKLY